MSAGVNHLEGFPPSFGNYLSISSSLVISIISFRSVFTSIFTPIFTSILTPIFAAIFTAIFDLVICHLVLDTIVDTILLDTIACAVVSRSWTTCDLGLSEECTEDSRLLFQIEPSLLNRQAVSVRVVLWRWHLTVCPFLPFLASPFLEELLEFVQSKLELAPWSRQKFDIGCANAAEFGIGRVGVWFGDGFEKLGNISIFSLKIFTEYLNITHSQLVFFSASDWWLRWAE